MVNNNRAQYQLGKNLRTKSCTPHRIKIKDSIVKCEIGVTVDGNVTLEDEGSWDEVDGSSIGNIKKHSLRYLIEQHNNNCLLSRRGRHNLSNKSTHNECYSKVLINK